MEAPEHVVYSTDPRRATGLDGKVYFVKGPDQNVAVAEAVAYQLAQEVGLPVPEFGLVLSDDGSEPSFASCEVAHCHRSVDDWIVRKRTTNPEVLPRIIAFDVWVANKDRNIGNLVGIEEPAGLGIRITLVAIDFEKSVALRGPYPLTTVNTIPATKLWPSGILGNLVKGAPQPMEFFATIEGINASHIEAAFGTVEAHLGAIVPWKENTVKLLLTRAKNIRTLVQEVWQ